MDQSLDNTLSEVLQPTPSPSTHADAVTSDEQTADMFYHTTTSSTAAPAAAASKPSALQRIYEAKKVREEKQPEKYRHRPDCYVDKPNNDSSFWKPSPHSDSQHAADHAKTSTSLINSGCYFH